MSGVVRLAGTVLLASLFIPVAVAVGQTSTGNAPTRQILDRYCVTCHNERLKTAGLMLDQIDLEDVAGNAAILEKVVRKLRAGQMPPEGRPRPDESTIDAFATSLEFALDSVAIADPNPGRVVTRRLNRVEYVLSLIHI